MANAEVGSAYVSIYPQMDKSFAGDVTGALEETGTLGGTLFGDGMLASFAGMASKIIAALGLVEVAQKIGEVGKQALDAYASNEQLWGGVQKLFGASGMSVEDYAASVGKSVDEIRGEYDQLRLAEGQVSINARNAFETAGMSANDYMETVTSFSASLINSLDGDTAKAASQADKAIRDMSDNANTFGTDMTSIQNAYQGFAKQNYTMLDNLKLGYGGTKEEMQRLLDDAEAISGVHYDISSYSDVIDAIHTIQEEQHIAGTTANEAADTVEGSTKAMKASWTNWLTELGSSDADMETVSQQLAETVVNAARNTLRVIGNIIKNGIQALPMVLSSLGQAILDAIGWDEFAEKAMTAWADMRAKIDAKLLEIETAVATKWEEIKTALSEKLTSIKEGIALGWENVKTTATEKWEAIKAAISAKWESIKLAVTTAITNLKTSVTTAWDNVKSDATAKWEAIKTAISSKVDSAKTAVSDKFNQIKTTISGVWDSIKSTASSKWESIKTTISDKITAAKNKVSDMIDAIKDLFNFHISWPHIPLPHFSVSGSANPLDWLTNGVPHISVDWYAKGGIFNEASLIGVGEGRSPEAVLPLNDRTLGNIAGMITKNMRGVTNNYYIDGNLVAADARLASALDVVAERVGGRRRMGALA
jgi:hypothetical protein